MAISQIISRLLVSVFGVVVFLLTSCSQQAFYGTVSNSSFIKSTAEEIPPSAPTEWKVLTLIARGADPTLNPLDPSCHIDSVTETFVTHPKSVKALYENMSNGSIQMNVRIEELPVLLVDNNKIQVEQVMEWQSQMNQAALARGIDPETYKSVYYITPICNGSGCRRLPAFALGKTAWMGSVCTDRGIVAHELGHTFGLSHASAIHQSGERLEYGDSMDFMGAVLFYQRLNAPHLQALGFLPENHTREITEMGTYPLLTLYDHEGAVDENLKRAYQFTFPSGKRLWISFRKRTLGDNWDSNMINEGANEIHLHSLQGNTLPGTTLEKTIPFGESFVMEGYIFSHVASPNSESASTGVQIARVPGDLDNDCDVDFDDAFSMVNNYGLTGATWSDGDFDGNGTVDFEDAFNLNNWYGYRCFPIPQLIPSAATISVNLLTGKNFLSPTPTLIENVSGLKKFLIAFFNKPSDFISDVTVEVRGVNQPTPAIKNFVRITNPIGQKIEFELVEPITNAERLYVRISKPGYLSAEYEIAINPDPKTMSLPQQIP